MTPNDQDLPRWRPLLRISARAWLGVIEGDEGTLWTGDEAGRCRQVDPDGHIGCLPLLERPYDEVRAELSRGANTWAPATRIAMNRVVPAGVIEAAFRIGTDYWLRRACTWLEALGPSEQTAVWALRLENATGATQATRHEARRVRRSWPPS